MLAHLSYIGGLIFGLLIVLGLAGIAAAALYIFFGILFQKHHITHKQKQPPHDLT